MADTVEMQDIRGLDIDKLAKGFADVQYIFKHECSVLPMKGDSIRWFSKTAGTLSATAPSVTKNVSPLSIPATLEVSWTRNTAYPKKYFVEGFISMEDIESAELDVLATTIRDLTRVIARDVDEDIWSIFTAGYNGTTGTISGTINGFDLAIADAWNAASAAGNIVDDIMHAKRLIYENDYNPEGSTLLLNPFDYQSMVTWLIDGKGSSIPGFSSEKIKSGVVMQLLGVNIKVSNNVTVSEAVMIIPKKACTFRQQFPITAKTVKEEGIGTRIRVYEHGTAYLTDPKAVCLITGLAAGV